MIWSQRTSIYAFLLSALFPLIAAAPAPGWAATVTVTDCTASGPAIAKGKTTVLDVRPDDLVLQCALTPLPGTERILVRANKITIDGPAGGISSPFKGRSIDVRADADIVVRNAVLDAANGNARMRLRSVTGFDIDASVLTAGDVTRPGRELRIECSGDLCPLEFSDSTFEAGRIRMLIQGEILGDLSTIRTASPRDRILIRSFQSNVIFCDVDVLGDVEGRIDVLAFGDIDLTASTLSIGRDINILAGLGGTGQVVMKNTTVRNDFGKPGDIIVEAAGGAGQVDIVGATIIDDDKPATVNDVSEINSREEAPHEGFNNTVGTPNLDT
jgi:hypothetical protein